MGKHCEGLEAHKTLQIEHFASIQCANDLQFELKVPSQPDHSITEASISYELLISHISMKQ